MSSGSPAHPRDNSPRAKSPLQLSEELGTPQAQPREATGQRVGAQAAGESQDSLRDTACCFCPARPLSPQCSPHFRKGLHTEPSGLRGVALTPGPLSANSAALRPVPTGRAPASPAAVAQAAPQGSTALRVHQSPCWLHLCVFPSFCTGGRKESLR